ncbi:hypothetical protein A2635_01500 [Candidatus Peribacteria bacterium RIFCSPHIGHO2_01_FULL_51_9]|nr:MAG: hypothetical protein A2635_01500 [Candidatus Peribacteria bacterium RIFCSPHIGHO2_01_FULL_51_9]
MQEHFFLLSKGYGTEALEKEKFGTIRRVRGFGGSGNRIRFPSPQKDMFFFPCFLPTILYNKL